MTALSIQSLESPYVTGEYALVVVALGYEERARHLAHTLRPAADTRIAWAFDRNRVLDYETNRSCFAEMKYEIVSEKEGNPHAWIRDAAQRSMATHVCRVLIDISSMSRQWLARVIQAIRDASRGIRVEVDFVYSAAYYIPPSDVLAPNVWAGPVLPSFAGWTNDPALPTILVLGLGYEPERGIGAVEYIEPAEVIACEPVSSQPEFTATLELANEDLWNLRPRPRRLSYRVEHPYGIVVLLDGLLGRLVARARPVILPFGPKVFALASLLVAHWYPSIAVWRVSAGADETPLSRRPTGELCGVRAVFDSRPSVSPPLNSASL